MSETPLHDTVDAPTQDHAQQPAGPFTQRDVLALWRCAEHNSTIPNEALDAMRDALLASIHVRYEPGPDPSLQPDAGKLGRF
ncbi:hypothetical protein PY254_11670 [Rhodanobacter sp. AS-Z3]|uniref:hypothetical protein n=1 Tax=Rhodanobacter sp. AS-Z3 TaxID=3031330 RepID=UPI00247A574B|nr:hypothetical protein [Rhodanobacter sp. AS-Z3]WEN13898.1 hypothetical protein PY254_11670 [Rhodanobacter sp. AS-Z3]